MTRGSPRANPRMTSALLLFPHQLFASNRELAHGRHVLLIEDWLLFDQYAFHRQKLVLHRATMRMHAAFLAASGVRVTHVDAADAVDLDPLVRRLAADGVGEVEVIDVVDDWLEQRVRRACDAAGVSLRVHDTPMFLSSPGFLHETLARRRKLFMARFYAAQRQRLGILVHEGQPVGGRWSFDVENRKRLPRDVTPPSLPRLPENAYVQEAKAYVRTRYPGNPGSVDDFAYPVTYDDAAAWLRTFLDERFACFGDYEDAISTRHPTLFHAVLTPMLNTGLLTPDDVVGAALEHAERHAVPLNSLEGFIRQVIGWREFMRGAYVLKGRAQRTRNFFGHHRKLPSSFYTGTTGIDPLDDVIRGVLTRAYAHHIERLMVLGNFMLLCEIEPDLVYRWFMELFIDAYDWVMVPNVYGMALHADGGIITTKPYVAAASYLLKMSDYRRGAWSVTWDGLFWRFIATHKAFFAANPRLSMLVRQLDRMPDDRLRAHRAHADRFLETLG